MPMMHIAAGDPELVSKKGVPKSVQVQVAQLVVFLLVSILHPRDGNTSLFTTTNDQSIEQNRQNAVYLTRTQTLT